MHRPPPECFRRRPGVDVSRHEEIQVFEHGLVGVGKPTSPAQNLLIDRDVCGFLAEVIVPAFVGDLLSEPGIVRSQHRQAGIRRCWIPRLHEVHEHWQEMAGAVLAMVRRATGVIEVPRELQPAVVGVFGDLEIGDRALQIGAKAAELGSPVRAGRRSRIGHRPRRRRLPSRGLPPRCWRLPKTLGYGAIGPADRGSRHQHDRREKSEAVSHAWHVSPCSVP